MSAMQPADSLGIMFDGDSGYQSSRGSERGRERTSPGPEDVRKDVRGSERGSRQRRECERLFDGERDDAEAPRTIRFYVTSERPITDENHRVMRQLRQYPVLVPMSGRERGDKRADRRGDPPPDPSLVSSSRCAESIVEHPIGDQGPRPPNGDKPPCLSPPQAFAIHTAYQKAVEHVRWSERKVYRSDSCPGDIILLDVREWYGWDPKRQAFAGVRQKSEVEVQMKGADALRRFGAAQCEQFVRRFWEMGLAVGPLVLS